VIDQFVVVDIIGNIANLGTSQFVYANCVLTSYLWREN